MTSHLRRLLRSYVSQRSPWGPPWWVYVVAFGAANLVRQGAILLAPAAIPTWARVASWVVTLALVVGVVTGVDALHRAVAGSRRPSACPDIGDGAASTCRS